MARTAGVPKPDRGLKNQPQIDWTGNVIRDGRGYYGEQSNTPEVVRGGAFPPPEAIRPDDFSRRRYSPAEQLKREMAAAQTAPSAVTTQKIVDGAVVEEKNSPRKGNPGNSLKEFWVKLRSDPKAMEEFVTKKKAGLARYLEKRKAK